MLISLIIPTRERATFLQESIRTALAIPDSSIEIVVSDNASSDNTRDVVSRQSDPRLRYVSTGRRVSMRQNFEFALEQSRGDYVIYIGDDDGFLPAQFQWLRMTIERHRPDCFSWRPLTYGWPVDGYGSGGVRLQKKQVFGAPTAIGLNDAATKLRSARLLELGGLPAVYHGCASRAWLGKIRSQSGAAFAGRIPDVYFTYYSTLASANFFYAAHPFTINGYSPASTGGAHHAYRSGDKRIEPAVKFGAEASSDPLQDVIREHVPTIPLNFFSTYETVRTHLGFDQTHTNHEAWYRYVLTATNSRDKKTHASVVKNLKDYAAATHTEPQFQRAQRLAARRCTPNVVKMKSRLDKVASRIQSVKFSAAHDRSNTIFTAARLVDDLLATEYGRVLKEGYQPTRAWVRLLGRGIKRRLSGVESGGDIKRCA